MQNRNMLINDRNACGNNVAVQDDSGGQITAEESLFLREEPSYYNRA